jgi:Ca2+-binding EF-hand superfamily protein
MAIASAAAPAEAATQAPSGQPAATKAPQQVTKAQFQQNVDSRFGAVDSNKDGSLTKAEITAAQAKALQQAQAMEAKRIDAEFKKLDTNKDNQLSLAEFKAVAPAVKAAESPEQMIAGLDSNKDGKVSAAEYRAQPMANFDKADSNHDGILTAQEVGATRQR